MAAPLPPARGRAASPPPRVAGPWPCRVAAALGGLPVVAPPPPGPMVARGHATAAVGRAEGRCHAAALRLSLPPPSWRLGGRGPVSPPPPHWWLVDRGCAALVEPGCRLGMAWRFLLLVKTMFVLRTGDDGA